VGVLGVALFTVGGLGLWRTIGGSSMPPVTAPDVQSDRLAGTPFIGSGSLVTVIHSLQERLRAVPGDWRSYANLGLAYVQQARITADPSYYPKAEGVLRRSLTLERHANAPAFTGLGALALARHDFAGALRWGREAHHADPYDDNALGVIGDAQVELGRYPQAFRTIQRMVDLKPTLASYARASYARELQGDVPGAVAAMRLALQAASDAEDGAWTAYQLGELAWNSGQLDRAAAMYRRASMLDPAFVPPRAGLAKVAWARGRTDDALAGYRSVVADYPLPEYVIALGDLESTTGRAVAAARTYQLVRAEEALFRANGVNVDLELALFDADHGRPAAAVRVAREEWGRRHSVLVADALGWALYRDGRAREALPFARRATVLGFRNALLYFHAGMIEQAAGDPAAARRLLRTAVATNPHFSILHSAEAERALRSLGGAA
jgi:tetratricopeptide (TPR) repeat protein